MACDSGVSPFSFASHLLQGGAARLARQAHNLKVVGSNPTPAPNFKSLIDSGLINKTWKVIGLMLKAPDLIARYQVLTLSYGTMG